LHAADEADVGAVSTKIFSDIMSRKSASYKANRPSITMTGAGLTVMVLLERLSIVKSYSGISIASPLRKAWTCWTSNGQSKACGWS
jgi:hypothetical protein